MTDEARVDTVKAGYERTVFVPQIATPGVVADLIKAECDTAREIHATHSMSR